MPFYDINRAITTNASAGTENTHLWGKTVANQETVSIMDCLVSMRGGVAGGATVRIKSNSGTVASGGTATTPSISNQRMPAALSTWFNDATAITPGATLLVRAIAGVAQTGGSGGLVPVVPGAAIQMMANSVNPVDVEVTSLANGSSVAGDLKLGILEGIA